MRSALIHACCSGQEDCASAILDAGADVDAVDEATGMKPAHFAAMSGSWRILEMLSRRGAALDATTVRQRWTPLHFASYYGHKDIVKVAFILRFILEFAFC